MASFSTHDLRATSTRFNRVHEHKHKWAYGNAEGKPLLARKSEIILNRRFSPSKSPNTFIRRQRALNTDIDFEQRTFGNESFGESIEDFGHIDPPDADITYTFDHAHGPVGGDQVLGLALDQAVERFENVQTEKLVKDQYEMVDGTHAGVVGEASRLNGQVKKWNTRIDEDEYEFI